MEKRAPQMRLRFGKREDSWSPQAFSDDVSTQKDQASLLLSYFVMSFSVISYL
jgi:hypothetical protein